MKEIGFIGSVLAILCVFGAAVFFALPAEASTLSLIKAADPQPRTHCRMMYMGTFNGFIQYFPVCDRVEAPIATSTPSVEPKATSTLATIKKAVPAQTTDQKIEALLRTIAVLTAQLEALKAKQ